MTGPHGLMRHDQRQKAANHEFAQWRESHPNFTSRELLDAWRAIRQRWHLMETDPGRKRR